ncbi:uncharacterized protein LOC120165647 [Hibiscus syriacus]|uniref:uncharacterized protein LOC120165647 n=1 Tax=Hibiscus syriacus TaxID=106335 RepID=UPI001924CACD|nr:uncharacterized protein LOC120165647 [Hibiscus syriacus]
MANTQTPGEGAVPVTVSEAGAVGGSGVRANNRPGLAAESVMIDGTLFNLNDDVGPIKMVSAFIIKNGNLSDSKSLLVKASIPEIWHWRPIANLPPEHALEYVPMFIRIARAGLMQSKPVAWTNDQLRKMAIIVGVARAVSTKMYDLTEPDFIPEEMKNSYVSATFDGERLTGFTIAEDVPATYRQYLTAVLDLTDTERAVVATLHMCSIGIIPVQGYSLIMTGHHYLNDPNSQSRKAYAVMERAYWSATGVTEWFQNDITMIQDALWHKSCHPVNLTIKYTTAYNENTAQMLVNANAGPAASRLPALEPEMRAANSYKTLLQTVRPMYEMCGATTDFVTLEEAITMVKLYPFGASTDNLVQPRARHPTIPPWVNNRYLAIQHLKNILEANVDIVANAYGFYCQMVEQATSLVSGGASDTLKTSFSLSLSSSPRVLQPS